MAQSVEDLSRRLHNAQESLDTELKSWIKPTTDQGKMVIAKACMALRNNNGGFLIIGIRDNGKPDERSFAGDLRAAFHHDCIQEIISKYSSERFEVIVHFVEREGHERIMIEVLPGVRTPVICRCDLPKNDMADRPRGSLLAENAIYMRTLAANGRPSTAPAGLADWPRIMENCFDNREADIGGFLRRQLSAINVENTAAALYEVLRSARLPSPTEMADQYLNECFTKFAALKDRHRPRPPDCGIRDVAAIIVGDVTPPDLTQEFMVRLGAQSRRYSGWAPWVALMNIGRGQEDARFVQNGWEALIFQPSFFNTYDFSRIEASGKFYYLEGLRDDLTSQIAPGQQLEFVFETKRVTEILVTALSFAKLFSPPCSGNDLSLAMRWRGLAGRRLSSWAHPGRGFITAHEAVDDEILSHVTIPIETPLNAVGLQVESLVKPLFMLFGGWVFDPIVVSQIVDSMLGGHS